MTSNTNQRIEQEIKGRLDISEKFQRKLNREICILIAEINEQMIYQVQKANFQNKPACELSNQLERSFKYTVEKADSDDVINFPETISGYIQDRLNRIADKQARIEQEIFAMRVARQTLEGMVNFQ
tara:strand:+ start:1318 stop:1695 length:378 start_codon:yes stop_codon:yes gene_type:complete